MELSLIVGLGNPGPRYIGTRHNLGFEVVTRIARLLKATALPDRSLFEWAQVEQPQGDTVGRLVLAWPATYMNGSGAAVVELLEELAIDRGRMLVVVDDVNLPLGVLRIRPEGSDGGHNGLASIIEHLVSEQFPRLRLGVGLPPGTGNVADYVLSRFEENELESVERMVALAAEAVIFAATHRLEEAMSKYNRNPALPEQE